MSKCRGRHFTLFIDIVVVHRPHLQWRLQPPGSSHCQHWQEGGEVPGCEKDGGWNASCEHLRTPGRVRELGAAGTHGPCVAHIRRHRARLLPRGQRMPESSSEAVACP
ncbi:hypothetical protein V3C99_005952 [Haemonchus contortus]